MKTYQKPEAEVIKFTSESVANSTVVGGGNGGYTSNIIPANPDLFS